MSRWLKCLVLLAIALQVPAALAVTGFRFVSTRGDWIGQGARASYLPPEATFTVSGTDGLAQIGVSTASEWWSLDFAAPAGEPLAPGSYPDAARFPFQSPLGAGLSLSGNGRGCNTLKGWFRVLEYVRAADGGVKRLAIDFVQNCEVSGPPLYASLRINSRHPLVVPPMAAVAGADFAVFAGDAARLDASQSFSRRGGALSLRWTQTDGPAVELDDPTAVAPAFSAPEVPIEGAVLRFRLDATDGRGRSDSDETLVVVESALAPRTQIRFHGDGDDYITGGRSYDYQPRNALIGFSRNFDNGVSVSINGDTWWNLDLAAPADAALLPGDYMGAQRFPFQDSTAPGLSLSGDGRGCNTLTGQFTVYQAEYDDAGAPIRLDLSFEQHCEGGAPAAYGTVLMNAVPHETVARRLRAARRGGALR